MSGGVQPESFARPPARARAELRRALRRALRTRREELRSRLRALRGAARERVNELPAIRKARTRRRVRRSALLALVALAALFARCDCQPEPTATVEAKAPDPPAPVKPDAPGPPRPRPLRATGARVGRASLANEARAAPSWMEEYRLQVAARSPRLARCFLGIDRPGAFRWTASVSPASGAVTEHELEPLGSDDLGREQRDCVLAVLSAPPYRLTTPGTGALPDRVGLVIEF